MAEETRQSILAEAKKKLKEYWQRNSPGGPAGVKKNRKTNGSSPETATSGGSHSPGDSATGIDREGPTSSAPLKDLESPSQELAAVLDSRFVKISRLNNIIKSLERQKKQVEHQLEEEKKANNEKQKTERELEVQIQRLNVQKKKLTIDVYRTKRSLIYFEEECKDLAGRLQQTLQCIEELEQALSAVPATQEEKEISSSSHRKACMEWKLEWSTREQALLKAQLTQVCTLKKEKKDDTHRVEELKRSLSKLKHQMAKPLPPEPPAVPAEEELQHLRKELERVSAELQAHVENHQHVSLLNQPQKERLGRQEERLRKQEEKLPQLAEPQSGVEELNNENKSALQSEQQVEELQETLDEERLEASSQQSQQLNAPLNLTALPGEGDGGEHLGSAEEEAPQPMPSLPEDLESWEAMSGCMDHREEMADLSELVEKPELPFIEYWGERCHQNVHQLLTEAGGSAEDAAMGGGHHRAGPAQGGDEGGAAGDAITACADHNNEHSKLLTSSQNPAHEPRPGVPDPQELGAAHKHGDLCEVSLTVSAETGQGEAREGSPHDNPTAQPIAQEQQEHPGLGSNLCVPFFCWAWLRRRRR
uniref:Golgin subfamily A conserved domain-containing protein n=1 Tax=Cercocebus atys TaxID=9531 RepID=A0A2K5L419_CERAT